VWSRHKTPRHMGGCNLHGFTARRHAPRHFDPVESKRAKQRMLNYHWQDQSLYFKGLLVLRPKDRMGLVV
jgi:hypothetical protein